MSITKKFHLVCLFCFVILFGSQAHNAHAATYSVQQTYSGVFNQTVYEEVPGTSILETSASLIPVELTYGDSGLFSNTLLIETKYLFDVFSSSISCAGSCIFTETLKNGDTIFGNLLSVGASGYEFASNGIDIVKTFYSGTLEITGGTGLFAGAMGGGVFHGFDDYATMTQTVTSSFTVTAVPEPSNLLMLLIGMFFIAIVRNKQLI